MALAAPRIAVPPVIDAGALAGLDPSAPVVELGGETMGTYWRTRFATVPGLDPAVVRRAIEARLAALVDQMSHWAPESLLSRFNRAPGGAWLDLSADVAAVVETGLAIAARTDGAFDPAVGRLTDIHGLGPNPVSAPPDEAAIATARGVSGWRRLAFDAETRRLRQPGGLWLDLSGIGKGHAVDAVADLLRDMGARHALVEIGGECVGRGMRPDGDPWWVDLETPPGLSLPPLRIALHQLAVATSGNQVRGDHTLDPRTGRPVRNGIVSASVLHASCMQADAWATALTVLGPEAGAALAEDEGLAARLVMVRDDGVEEWLSAALRQML